MHLCQFLVLVEAQEQLGLQVYQNPTHTAMEARKTKKHLKAVIQQVVLKDTLYFIS